MTDAVRHTVARRTCAMLLALAALAILAAPAGAGLRTAFIDPTLTDPLIEPLTDLPGGQLRNTDHLVAFDDTAPRRNQLYVHLVGSGGTPDFNQEIVSHAASLGYHVVSLAYPNYPSVDDLAGGTSDPTLHERIRRERIYGEDLVDTVDVDPANSILNRLVRLLAYNHGQHPGEGWDQYLLDADTPAWQALAVGGHSQGAGHAAYLSKHHPLDRVVYFAGPGDFYEQGPAPWLLAPGVTDAGRMFGFTHVDDANALAFFFNYRNLGLDAFGPVVNVDGTGPPYDHSHRLTSDLEPANPGEYHGAVVVDRHLPLDGDGRPVYLPAWTYLLTAAVPEPGSLVLLLAGAALAACGGRGRRRRAMR